MPIAIRPRLAALWLIFPLVFGGVAGGAAADSFTPVTERAVFLSHVKDRTLRLSMFDISIAVNANGTITGQALGWDLSGNWEWDQGLFCREIDWSGSIIPRNCQLVEVEGGDTIRFTVDAGEGRSAVFKIK